jgi:hypothetical protein
VQRTSAWCRLAAAFQTYWAACLLELGCQTFLLVRAWLWNHHLGFLLEYFCPSHNSVRQTVNLKEQIYICDLRVLLNSAHDCSEVGRLAAAASHSVTQFAVQHHGWLNSCTSVKDFFVWMGMLNFPRRWWCFVLCIEKGFQEQQERAASVRVSVCAAAAAVAAKVWTGTQQEKTEQQQQQQKEKELQALAQPLAVIQVAFGTLPLHQHHPHHHHHHHYYASALLSSRLFTRILRSPRTSHNTHLQ